MSKDFENVKDIFTRLYANKRRYLTEEEISNLRVEETKNVEYDDVKNRKYILEPMQFSDEEFTAFLAMKQVDKLNDMDNKLRTIKNILIFWVTLTILGLIMGLLTWFA